MKLLAAGRARIPKALLINPFVHDTAAYDFWAKPKGLIEVGRILTGFGFTVDLIDCMYKEDPGMAVFAGQHGGIELPRHRFYGTGSYYRQEIEKPHQLKKLPRRWFRYGFHPDLLRRRLLEQESPPELIGVTGIMTYWHTGVAETIAIARKCFPETPILLGGIYPTLLPRHAAAGNGVHLYTGQATPARLGRLLVSLGLMPDQDDYEKCAACSGSLVFYPYPDVGYGVVNCSEGCPRQCTYCASRLLRPEFIAREPDLIFTEISRLAAAGIKDFAFYDDALLFRKESGLLPLLRRISHELPGLRFHTPNGMHLDYLDREIADLMRQCNFTTLRFGLETADPVLHRRTGQKVRLAGFREKIALLRQSGFESGQIGVYVMIGIPGQAVSGVEQSLEFVKECGVQPYITEFSPVPGTREFDNALKDSPVDFAVEPLLQNNSLLPLRNRDFDLPTINRLKNLCYC